MIPVRNQSPTSCLVEVHFVRKNSCCQRRLFLHLLQLARDGLGFHSRDADHPLQRSSDAFVLLLLRLCQALVRRLPHVYVAAIEAYLTDVRVVASHATCTEQSPSSTA